MKQTYAIFGLGRYGTAVARELVRNGAEALAVDSDEEIVNSLADELPYCKCADVTDPDVLRQLVLKGVPVCDYHRAPMNLEKVFMEVTQDA